MHDNKRKSDTELLLWLEATAGATGAAVDHVKQIVAERDELRRRIEMIEAAIGDALVFTGQARSDCGQDEVITNIEEAEKSLEAALRSEGAAMKADETIAEISADRDDLRRQIRELAEFIMGSIPGEPSQNEGAVKCAIRVMGDLRGRIDAAMNALRESFCPVSSRWQHPIYAAATAAVALIGWKLTTNNLARAERWLRSMDDEAQAILRGEGGGDG